MEGGRNKAFSRNNKCVDFNRNSGSPKIGALCACGRYALELISRATDCLHLSLPTNIKQFYGLGNRKHQSTKRETVLEVSTRENVARCRDIQAQFTPYLLKAKLSELKEIRLGF